LQSHPWLCAAYGAAGCLRRRPSVYVLDQVGRTSAAWWFSPGR
ncbi:hypothetical protein BAE44_0006616, partial [Dichanthelium oligosanthes]